MLSKVFLKRSNVKHRSARPFGIFAPAALVFLSIGAYICMRACGDPVGTCLCRCIHIYTDRQTEGEGREGEGERKRGIKARKTFKEEEKKVLTVRSHPWEHETGRRILI